MLDGLARGRFTVIPGAKALRAALMTRMLPERVTTAVADRIVARAVKVPGGTTCDDRPWPFRPAWFILLPWPMSEQR